MNDLLTINKISTFEDILRICKDSKCIDMNFDAIDGGAGSGYLSKKMLSFLEASSKVYSFEPFPGNHRFFIEAEQNIKLIPKALSNKAGNCKFRVDSVVQEESEWGEKGMTGYSSIGHCVQNSAESANDIIVECVLADEEVPKAANIGFIKLDLQGGELNALLGMRRILTQAKLMWVEYTGQKGLLNYISDNGFVIFDTEYFIKESPNELSLGNFIPTKTDVILSTGKTAWFGFRKKMWNNYEADFYEAKKKFNMVQTDLLCVSLSFIDDFLDAFCAFKSKSNPGSGKADFSNAAWNVIVNTTLAQSVSDPWGGTTASTVTATAINAILGRTFSGTVDIPYTYSIWMRRRTGTGNIGLRVGDNTTQLVTITDEWTRVWKTNNPTTTVVRAYVLISTSGDEVDIWGAKLEQASFPTSYIATTEKPPPRRLRR